MYERTRTNCSHTNVSRKQIASNVGLDSPLEDVELFLLAVLEPSRVLHLPADPVALLSAVHVHVLHAHGPAVGPLQPAHNLPECDLPQRKRQRPHLSSTEACKHPHRRTKQPTHNTGTAAAAIAVAVAVAGISSKTQHMRHDYQTRTVLFFGGRLPPSTEQLTVGCLASSSR